MAEKGSREWVLAEIDRTAREERTWLTLIAAEIAELPEEIGRLERLERVDFGFNKLTSLPESIGQLVNLKSLDVSDNRLTSLPESIGHLESLERLYLNQNQLNSLPESIGQLESLERLVLRNNKLTSLLESIGQLESLEVLDLRDNQLTLLPEAIGQLVNLRELDLRGNQLTSLPTSIRYLDNLVSLELGGNPLNAALAHAHVAGLDNLRAYLRSLDDERAQMQIFLCYAREDRERVEKLYRSLTAEGFRPWMDKDILPGEAWDRRIQQAIRDSDFFLACLSAHSVTKRGYVQREIRRALDVWEEMLEDDIYLIPVRLADCQVPERLARFQYVNLYDEDGWGRLVAALEAGMARRVGGGV